MCDNKNAMEKMIKYEFSDIKDILSEIKKGTIAIPNFQRDFVWDLDRMINFLNSILSPEPFGYIIEWKPSDDSINIDIRNEIITKFQKNINEKKEKFIIDGQQRLTTIFSLYMSKDIAGLDKKEIKNSMTLSQIQKNINKIYFNLDKFCFINKAKNDSSNDFIMPIYDAMWIGKKENFRNKIKEDYKLTSDQSDKLGEFKDKFSDIKYGVIKLENYDIDEVIEIFNKINTQGKKLTLFEIINSSWHSINIDLENEFAEISLEANNKYNFGDLDYIVMLDSLFLVIDENQPIINGKDKISFKIKNYKEIINSIIEKFKKSFIMACNFLSNVGFNYKTLPSELIIKWLTYLFYKNQNNDISGNDKARLLKYIYIISINNIYSSSTNNKILDNLIFVDALLKSDYELSEKETQKYVKLRNSILPEEIKTLTYRSTSMFSRFVNFVLYKVSKDIRNDNLIEATNCESINMHHLFPKKARDDDNKTYDFLYSEINSYANLMPICEETNKKHIKNNRPSTYYFELKNENNQIDNSLTSSFVDVNYFKSDNFEKFIDDRSEKIANYINNMISKEDYK